jgi:GNAT superfamily N-acetyltransferase
VSDRDVTVASRADEGRAVAALELAFVTDPLLRWFWPDPLVFRTSFARLVCAMGGAAFDVGTAHWCGDGRAVALWMPPGVSGDEDSMVTLMIESVHPDVLGDLAVFGELVSEHHPSYEHWYLPFTGVDPVLQGKGYGSGLLRHALVQCDRDGLPAYLEASTLRSRALYERLGFEVVCPIQAGASPTVWAMLRRPSSPSS